ncbi:MAG TPA: patatin-like phospholipase family protein [Thermoanaerobaculia bacterium]|nr:patatin-like phospholipase family protein [Thermoanaerobaculia bacterium]
MRRIVAVVAVVALSFSVALPAAAGGRQQGCRPCSELVPDQPLPACPVEPAQPATASASPLADPDRAIRALVLEGGGVKGVAYTGSLDVLSKVGRYDGIERVAGTSAGSLVALLVALGYPPDEIRRIVFNIDFRQFRDGSKLGKFDRLIEDFGLYRGEFALCLLQCLVSDKLGMPDATFADLEAKIAAGDDGFRRLYVVGTDLNNSSSTVFSYENEQTRDVPLALAARISMSFPVFFEAVRLDVDGNEDVWVDGGVLRNYPIRVFDSTEGPNPDVLGLHLGTAPARVAIPDFDKYVKQLFDTLLSAQVDSFCRTPADVERSVFIDPLGISTLDFNLTTKQKCDLMASGRDAMEKYLEEGGTQTCPGRLQPVLDDDEAYPLDG